MLLILLIFILLMILFFTFFPVEHNSYDDDDGSGLFFTIIIIGLISIGISYWLSLFIDGSKINTTLTQSRIEGFTENVGTGNVIKEPIIYASNDSDSIIRYYFITVLDNGRTDIDLASSDISGFKLNETDKEAPSIKKYDRSCETRFNTLVIWKSCGRSEVILTVKKGSIKVVKDFNPLTTKQDYDNAMSEEE